jgi:murein DD-endopeptidase MepM/ murein hydrolase activator NlpD
MPLLGVALLSAVESPRDRPAASAAAGLTASAGSEVATAELVEAPFEVPAQPLVWAPEPDYETLTLEIRSGDTLDRLFRKHDLNIGHLALIARLDEASKRFRRIKPGDVFEITHDDGELISMYSALDLTTALKIDPQEEGFTAQLVERPIEIRKRFAYGTIETSLYESAESAGLSDKLIMNLAGIFAWDIDFVLDIRSGDNYYVQWEEIWQEGEFVTDGEVVVAEFNNNGSQHRALRFVDDDGRSDYFTPDGRSVRKAFLRSPVDFRVSSSFNPNRLHPVLKTRRPHRGVDYAAPRGTPIKASGDGKVIFRGVKSGYGNTVILQHGGNITTLYAHMSRFASSARVGSRVRQGQTIGFVGKTGLVTGVHLHYEYRLNGVHRNPRTVELPQADPIADQYRDIFLAQADPILKELEKFKNTQLASIAFIDE